MTAAGSETTDDYRLIIAVILSATAVATAFSAFQAGKWGGAMTLAFTTVAKLQFEMDDLAVSPEP